MSDDRVEGRFRSIFEHAAVGLAITTPDGAIVEANAAFDKMLGYSPGGLRGRTVGEITFPDDRDVGLDLYERVISGQSDSYTLEKRYLRADGTPIWGRVSASMLRDADGRVAFVIGVIENIQAKKQADERLVEAENRYRTLVEELPLVTYIDALDQESSNIYTSPQIEPILGYSADEWQANPDLFVRLLHPDDRERVLGEVTRANVTGQRFVSEYRLRARDGHSVWFRDECVTVTGDDGRPLYSQGYLLDITARKQAEDALRESEERFRSLADDAPVLIWTADADGNVTFFSRSWLEFTGRPEEDQLGSGWISDIHPDDAEAAVRAYQGAIRGERTYITEYRVRRHDGEYRWIYDTGRPRFRSDGTLLGYVGVGVDVTESREAIRDLELRDAVLETVARLAGELLGAAGWEDVDFLTPLAAALGASRAFLAVNESRRDAATAERTVIEWAAEGVPTLSEDGRLKDFNLRAAGLGRWADVLAAGEPIRGAIAEMPEACNPVLEGVQSILLVPVFVDGRWWGTFGFDDLESPRAWRDAEIDALLAAAGILGGAVERQRAIRALRETTQTLEAIVDNSPLAIVASDNDGRITRWNPAAERMLGWTRDEVLGKPPPHFRPGDPDGPESRRRVQTGSAVTDAEARRRRKDGSDIDVRYAKAPLRDDVGEIVGTMALLTDITERKRAEQALLETTHALEAIVDSSPLAIVTFDVEGRVTRWNEAAERTFGWRAEEVIGRFNPMLPEGEVERFRRSIALALSGKSWKNVEVRRCHKDGSLIDVSASSAPLRDASGDVVGMVALLADISDQKRSERRLSAQHAVTRALAESSTLEDAAPDVLEQLCRGLEWQVGTFWIIDDELDALRPLATWHETAPGYRAFAETTGSIALECGTELPGRVWERGEAAWCADLTAEADTDRARWAARAGLHMSLAAPVEDGGRVLGVLEFVAGEARAPDEAVPEMLASVGRQLGQFLRRTEADAAVREREKRFRTLVANIPGVIYRCAADAAWTMEFLSEAIREITGYAASDFIDSTVRSYASVIHHEDVEGVAWIVNAAVARKEPFELEYRVCHADGTIRWVVERGQPIIGPGGKTVWIDGAIFDVTEQKRVEAERERNELELARANALLDSVVENLPVMLFLKDADDLRLVRINRAMEKLTGIGRDEQVGTTGLESLPRAQADFFLEKDREVLSTGELLDIAEEPYESRTLGTRYLHTRKVPILDEQGRARYLLGISEDITDARAAREERERLVSRLEAQNEQLRELDRLKDEFVALVSHELRTPLTSILGYLELILEGDVGEVTDEQEHFLGIIERNARRLLHLVGDLLFVAQIEAGKLSLEREPLDLLAIATECVEAAGPRASEKAIDLSLDGEPGTEILGDRVRLSQLLDNLVSNAIKFTPEGGRVDVRLGCENGEVQLIVTDTGIGISAEDQKHLFQRFYRTSEATKQAIQGTGLGLTITKAIVEAHGGTVRVESAEGRGTTFVVELPTLGESSRVESVPPITFRQKARP